MAIQSVTNDNLAEFVASRQSKTGAISTPDQMVAEVNRQADAKEAAKPVVVAAVTETTPDAPPDPGVQIPTAAKPVEPKTLGEAKQLAQKRIDELTRARKEAEEFAEDEYNTRLRAERRIGELEAHIAANKPVETKVEKPAEIKEPDPKDFSDAAAYAKALAQHEVKKALGERDAADAKKVAEAEVARQNALLAERIKQAEVDLPDFKEVIEKGDRIKLDPPAHIKAAIIESELGPQIAYHLAKFPEEYERILKMSPAKALLELGRVELKYTKAAPKPNGAAAAATTTRETSRAPEPVTPVRSDATGIVDADFSKPMDFKDYKRLRYSQLRGSRH